MELLIVIIILGILAAIALPRYFANIEKAREAEARCTLYSIRQAELAYYSAKGFYESSFPISVSLGGTTIDLAQPQSSSFTYTVETGYGRGKAATKITGGKDYYMCLESGKFGIGSISCP